ncbi:hypothetical protein SCLCIDRAFT_9454 [Scleroderma citrinum Foug A]|uniref:Retrovirus-related Pol polyprotein from transposon TNT 1-94-like beta-barrel domain-containing protein n=1 Tax=Scleroderma citrinum Foug A TaxID=1036808 RepID=A0A0C3DYK0_9AGAM|nr:hypothetical protein SCLCIDRAFT_9454 [Scleroderma citrinum Foug A]
MSEEVQNQIRHLYRASDIWMEACHLYANMTATDWTLTITALVTTRYTDGEDINAHITKMQGHLQQDQGGRSHTLIPGQPYCTNCKISGHRTEDCYSKGKRKEKKEDKKDKKKEEKAEKSQSRRPRKRPIKLCDDNHRSDSSLSAYLTSSYSHSHSRFGWILDGRSTNHICTDRTAFETFTPAHDTIQGIVKNGPELEVLGMGTVLISVSVKGRPD